MRALTSSLVLGSVVLAVAGCGGRQTAGTLDPDVLAKAELQYYWTVPVDLERGESISRLLLLKENVYCLTNRHRLIAVDGARGLFKWARTVADADQTVFRPALADNVTLPEQVGGIKQVLSPQSATDIRTFDAILVNTLSYVLVLDRQSGRQVRRIEFDFAANTGGASDGLSFYVGSTDGRYYAIRLAEAIVAWQLAAEDLIAAPVEYHNGNVYVADTSGTLTCARVGQPGKEIWSVPMSGAVTAEFHVDGRGCFVPCDDQRLYAFEPMSGARLWELPFVAQGPMRDPVQVAENTIFQYAEGDKFYAVALTSGKERWSRKDGRTVLAAFDGEVFLLNASDTLLILDEVLGTVKTSLSLTGWQLFAANTTAPAIYVATRDGRLACIRKVAAGQLTPEAMKPVRSGG